MTSLFPEKEDEDNYTLAIGKLTVAWATAEDELYRVLLKYAQVSDAIGRSIFSGIRARVMMDFIKNIAHNTNMDRKRLDDLEFVFDQMQAINKMRDKLTHYSTDSYSYPSENPRKRLITNHTRVSRYGKDFQHLVDPEFIWNIINDLYAIANHLNQHWGPRDGSFRVWEENPGERTTWLYKAPPLKDTSRKSSSTPRKQ